MLTLEHIATETTVQGGFTWARGRSNPTSGYVVAKPEYGKKIFGWDGSAGVIAGFVAEHLLTVAANERMWYGTWVSGDVLYLDLVEIIEDREDAMRLGRERNELAIYDAGTQSEIPLV
ncbi:hypothetical protein [Streptomyces yunnanensis]|uniref:Uncharacterized protein n=1 Tax=Streptomyces yunnanensis TaxID=156453 RepID=A0A9X8N7V9_9ACTN|nr:hypothetical protein [Streptomyces yunnanensis]SHN24583.1 hypothetical protein SAMN05216268_126116 [Streptomyces yunnanensis]